MKRIVLFLMISHLMNAMERPIDTYAAIREKVKKLVDLAIEKKEKQYEHSGVVSLSPAMVQAEVDSGPVHIDDEKALMVTDGKLFFVNYKNETISHYMNLPRHPADPAIVALMALKNMAGASGERILLGQDKGKVLVLDPRELQIRTFGHVHGRVLSIESNADGDLVAVKFTGKDSAGLPVPCFGITQAFQKEQLVVLPNPDSAKPVKWTSALQWNWTEFLTKQCEHEVRAITFENKKNENGDVIKYCITECATDYLERWRIDKPATDPKLVFVNKEKIIRP